MPNLRRARLPVPLLAAISDHARFWVPDPTYRLHWRPDGGELWQGSTGLLRADAVIDASQAIAAWAATQAFAAAADDDGPPSDDGTEPVG